MLPARQLAFAVTVVLPVAVASVATLAAPAAAHAAETLDACPTPGELAFLPSPLAPWKGAPLRVLFAAEKPFEGELTLIAPDGKVAASSHDRQGGPPYFWFAEVNNPAVGTWHAKLVRAGAADDCSNVTREIVVHTTEGPKPHAPAGSLWPIRAEWDRATENLYSAWIEKLFDAPLDQPPSWKALHEVIRDKSRNMLFNYLGLREDQIGIAMKPDCADLPYFLRAYFAFKVGLPFGYSKCTRADGGPPRCFAWWNTEKLEPWPAPPDPQPAAQVAAASDDIPASRSLMDIFQQPAPAKPVSPAARPVSPRPPLRSLGLAASFGQYLRIVGDGVHSATDRTALADENTDVYPVPLSQAALRPGTIYADPYGHVLMLVKRVAQTSDSAGVLLAVDAQPDGTVAVKRFWRGNFLFDTNPALGGPGFKDFRPIVQKGGSLRRLSNEEIAKNPQYAAFSLQQSKLSVDDFYDRMDDVMSPEPLDPVRALKEVITALQEQVETRVTSVENGRKYQSSGRGDAAMPDGAAIFETSGAWEDFATPSRDLRLLIAIDVVRRFPDHLARRPDRYAMPPGKSVADVKAELQDVLASELATRKFTYTRSDGSPWTLTLKDVVDRAASLEMAYNVNDCVELRWGAQDGSDENATCKRHAPAAQRARMSEYRTWFHDRRRPPRAGGA